MSDYKWNGSLTERSDEIIKRVHEATAPHRGYFILSMLVPGDVESYMEVLADQMLEPAEGENYEDMVGRLTEEFLGSYDWRKGIAEAMATHGNEMLWDSVMEWVNDKART